MRPLLYYVADDILVIASAGRGAATFSAAASTQEGDTVVGGPLGAGAASLFAELDLQVSGVPKDTSV